MKLRVLAVLAALSVCFLLLYCKSEVPLVGPFIGDISAPGGTVSARITIELSSSRDTVRANGVQRAIITARVFKVENGQNVPVANAQVQFSLTPQNMGGVVGTLSTTVGTTDSSGIARTTLSTADLTFVPSDAGVVIQAILLQDFRGDDQRGAPTASIFIVYEALGTAPPGGGGDPTDPDADPAPAITTVVPNSGPIGGGTTVLLFGTGFQSGATVYFVNSQRKDTIPSPIISPTLIEIVTIAVSATEVGPMSVFVLNPDGQTSNIVSFTYTATATNAPVLNNLIPAFGKTSGGDTITINGANFEQSPAPTVTFVNPGVASLTGVGVSYINAAQLTVVTPNAGPEGSDNVWELYVTNNGSGLTSNSLAFQFFETPQVQPPEIDAVIPGGLAFESCSGWPGDGDFNSAPAPTKCTSSPCNAFSASDQDIVIRGRNFAINCEVLWIASNTVYRLAQKQLKCNAEEGDIALCGGMVRFSESELRLTMIVPSAVGPGGAEVTTMFVINNPGQGTDEAISNSGVYSFSNGQDPADCIPPGPAPNIASVQPALGPTDDGGAPAAPPGCTVTITGSGFVDGATVFFGAVPAANVLFVNSTTLFVDTPVHGAGNSDILVRNPDSQTDIELDGYCFSDLGGCACGGVGCTPCP